MLSVHCVLLATCGPKLEARLEPPSRWYRYFVGFVLGCFRESRPPNECHWPLALLEPQLFPLSSLALKSQVSLSRRLDLLLSLASNSNALGQQISLFGDISNPIHCYRARSWPLASSFVRLLVHQLAQTRTQTCAHSCCRRVVATLVLRLWRLLAALRSL